MVDGFKSRVNSNVVPLAGARGAGAGAAIAEGVAQLGQVGSQIIRQDAQVKEQIADSEHRIAVEERRRALSAHAADRIGAWGQLQADISNEILNLRQSSQAGAVGHNDATIKLLRERVEAFKETLADEPEIAERFGPMLEDYEASTLLREREWEIQKRAQHEGNSFNAFIESGANQLMLNPTPKDFERFLADGSAALELMDADGTIKAVYAEKLKAAGSQAFIDGKFQRGEFADVENLVKSGFFNSAGIDLGRTLARIDDEKRAQAAIAKQAAADARTEARNAIKAVEAKIAIGVNVSQADINIARQMAVNAGLPEADIIGLDGLGIQQGLNRSYNPEADPDGSKAAAAVARLAPKIANGTATDIEEVTYNHLKGIADARAKDTGSALKKTAASGPNGQLQVLGQLRGLPVEQRYQAAVEAGGKNGTWLGQVSLLPERTQTFAVQGRALRDERPNDFGKKDDVRVAFDRKLGTQLKNDLGESYSELMAVAWDIYAASTASRGEQGWDQDNFDVAVRIAFGATKNAEGNLQGGLAAVNGRMTILPDNYTAPEMERTLKAADFKGAYYADGRPASRADILANYRMVYVGDSETGAARYMFVDAQNRPLLAKDGRTPAIKAFR